MSGRREKLEWLRDTYQRAIEQGLEPRDLAAVGSRLEKVLAELDGLETDDGAFDDELAARRSERLARAETAGS